MSTLPPFPVDDATLDLLWAAMHPDPDVFEQSGVGNFLEFMSQMGGSDTDAVEEVIDDGSHGGGARIVMMRDPQYHVNSVMSALIDEIRRLRAARAGGGE